MFKAAAASFSMDVLAVAWQSAVDNNYCDNPVTGQFAGSVNLSANLIAPVGGSNAALSATSASLLGGQRTFNQQISEVGVFTINAGGNTYLGTTLPSSTSANIGRFRPAQFVRSATQEGTYTSACGSFTYTGQVDASANGVITYGTVPNVTLTPQNQSGSAVQNYIGSFVKSPTATVSATSTQVGADGGTTLLVGSLLNPGSINALVPGSFQYAFSNADRFYFTRNTNALIAPFTNNITLNISALTDTDGVTSAALPWVIAPLGGEIRYGRMRLGNQYGPETNSLNIPLYTEYLAATGYQLNNLDNCYVYNSSNISLSQYTDSLVNGDTSVTGVGSVSSGTGELILSAPLNQHVGSVRLNYDAPVWLEYDFDNNGSLDNPYGTATFGRYRGHDKVIYWKELNY